MQLIVEKEGTLFTGERSNAFYEKMLVSHGSVSETARHHKPDNVEKSHASNWLFMYRLIDAIAFAYGGEQIESTVPRKSFLPLTIPVRCSLSIWDYPTYFLGRVGERYAMIGPVSSEKPALSYIRI